MSKDMSFMEMFDAQQRRAHVSAAKAVVAVETPTAAPKYDGGDVACFLLGLICPVFWLGIGAERDRR